MWSFSESVSRFVNHAARKPAKVRLIIGSASPVVMPVRVVNIKVITNVNTITKKTTIINCLIILNLAINAARTGGIVSSTGAIRALSFGISNFPKVIIAASMLIEIIKYISVKINILFTRVGKLPPYV